jgi:aldehyde dehydrogenase (NAD+)
MNEQLKAALSALGIADRNPGTFYGEWVQESEPKYLSSFSPVDGSEIAKVSISSNHYYEAAVRASQDTFIRWRLFPAPKRGEVIREIAEEFRKHKADLAYLLSTECGKILPEALGEVQEVIDIADFAVGLSRQLYGNTMHSERGSHRLYEQWHPLGVVGVITAFNFPVAVWSWNALIAAVCGDAVLWKPSEETPLTALASIKLSQNIAAKHGFPALFSLVNGDGPGLGQRIAEDRRIPLVSATGSCRMGKSVGETVAKRLGKSLLELGGNNAVIIAKDANLELASRAISFGAVGTAGQRCTTTRRIFVDSSLVQDLTKRLTALYKQTSVGDPRQSGTLMGPLINERACEAFAHAIDRVPGEGGSVIYGGKRMTGMPSRYYVEPTLVLAHKDMPLLQEETFAPIAYIVPVTSVEEAIEANNAVPQGLSSAIFTESLRSAEKFLAHSGSDCGIANVNAGTSGAEIGGAFGGEKETGGGREAGSDSWKAYMRRQTCTINWSLDLPLAQGIKFGE